MRLDLVQTLSDLVALPSVNPMGLSVTGPEYLEHRVTDYLERLFQKLKLPYERQMVEPQRENIIARLDGDVPPSEGGELLLFEAHQDTVPVNGMTIEPWTPVVRDGRIYGRGSCDIKGGMAAMLCAIARLAEEPRAGRPTIVMACTVNEEYGHSGATKLTELWSQSGSLLSRRPDAAIVSEPTLLQVVVAHKGVVRWKCHARGRAGHSSQPDLGDSAIYRMARVVTLLEKYHREVTPTLVGHPLCGRPTLSVGTITGGVSINTVPDHVTIQIDRRVAPDEDPREAYDQVLEFLAGHLKGDPLVEHEPPLTAGRGMPDTANAALADCLAGVVDDTIGGRCTKMGVPYGTDAAAYAGVGVPSVVFGPGSIDQAHTADEWLAIDQLEKASEIYYRFGRVGMCGPRDR